MPSAAKGFVTFVALVAGVLILDFLAPAVRAGGGSENRMRASNLLMRIVAVPTSWKLAALAAMEAVGFPTDADSLRLNSSYARLSSSTIARRLRGMQQQVDNEDYYDVLGVTRRATDAELKKAFRTLAFKWHPDKYSGNKAIASEKFTRISDAYNTLSDPDTRAAYDKYGKRAAGVGAGTSFGARTAVPKDDGFVRKRAAEWSGTMGGGMGDRPAKGVARPGVSELLEALRRSYGRGGKKRLPDGTHVIIRNLKSRPELNGRLAVVHGFQVDRQRYDVMVQGEHRLVSLATDKLDEVVAGVRIRGLIARTELNGQVGTLVGIDMASHRFEVQVSSTGSTVSLLPENVVLPNGLKVKIVGVRGRPELNGLLGTIHSFDAVAGRYAVQVSPRTIKKLRPVNVRPRLPRFERKRRVHLKWWSSASRFVGQLRLKRRLRNLLAVISVLSPLYVLGKQLRQ